MGETIEVEVGSLYAEMHEQYSNELAEQYEERLRQQTEDFLHNFNQQVERQQEQMGQQAPGDLEDTQADLELEEDEQ
jgi:ElaB/YqjD/DUF883 family membrane-anchored ribosome-binding protein